MEFLDKILSSWYWIGGISGGILLVSILVGYLLARAKIKKGFDVYED